MLWPPPDRLAEAPPDTDPNLLALVIRARWHRFTMLLTADAEAESTPLDPGLRALCGIAAYYRIGADPVPVQTMRMLDPGWFGIRKVVP